MHIFDEKIRLYHNFFREKEPLMKETIINNDNSESELNSQSK